jgi:hypothetical protein
MPEMPDDELRNAVHAIVSRLQADVERQLAELDGPLSELERRHQAECEQVRRETEARTAEVAAQEWAAKLEHARGEVDRVRAESDARLRAELAEATTAADARLAAETARLLAEAEHAASEAAILQEQQREQAVLEASVRAREEVRREGEQRAAESAARIRDERDGAAAQAMARIHEEHAAERDRLIAELEAERQRSRSLSSSLDEAQAALAVGGAADATLLAEERQAKVAMVEQLMTAVRSVSEARSLSDTLNALAAAAASLAPRAALFILNERAGSRELQGWRASGFADPSPAMMRLPADDGGLLATAASSRTPISTSTVSAPDFAALAADRAAIAMPLTVGGKTVAVIYADDGTTGEAEAPSSWPEAIQILGTHASVCLSHITAVRTTQAMRANVKGEVRGDSVAEEDHSARRYARLLVSEIKLYNEAAVRAGREKRDLLTRLRPEIERARRLYEERIPASIGARGRYFQEELVHTLADGDAALLGSA